VRVRLVSWSYSKEVNDPRKLVVLAVKVSSGKVREKGLGYYLEKKYSEEEYRSWFLDALKYPSVLEHIVFTFYIEGISRICSHQLVRHRIASYTQESQRYSESYMKKAVEKIAEYLAENPEILVVPGLAEYMVKVLKGEKPSLEEEKKLREAERKALEDWKRDIRKKLESGDPGEYASLIDIFLDSLTAEFPLGDRICRSINSKEGKRVLIEAAEEAFVFPPSVPYDEKLCLAEDYLLSIKRYYELIAGGVPREDARFVIPQAIKTALLMTVNLRELLHIARLRLSEKAQWEIRGVVKEMVREVEKIIPEIHLLVKES